MLMKITTKFIQSFIRQFLVFLIYLVISSIVLINHSGGMDIAFNLLMIVFGFIHVFFLISKINYDEINEKQNAWGIFDFISFCLIVMIYINSWSNYINFMWWFTNLKI